MNRIIAILSASLFLVACHTVTAESQPAMLGLYFDSQGNRMGGMPPALTVFDAYLILKDAEYNVTGDDDHQKDGAFEVIETPRIRPHHIDSAESKANKSLSIKNTCS